MTSLNFPHIVIFYYDVLQCFRSLPGIISHDLYKELVPFLPRRAAGRSSARHVVMSCFLALGELTHDMGSDDFNLAKFIRMLR